MMEQMKMNDLSAIGVDLMGHRMKIMKEITKSKKRKYKQTSTI